MTPRDMWNRYCNLGDYIAYASTARLWVGRLTDIRLHDDQSGIDKIQIATEDGDGTIRKHSFDYVPSKMFRIEEAHGQV